MVKMHALQEFYWPVRLKVRAVCFRHGWMALLALVALLIAFVIPVAQSAP